MKPVPAFFPAALPSREPSNSFWIARPPPLNDGAMVTNAEATSDTLSLLGWSRRESR
jgi:hypothetical protein